MGNRFPGRPEKLNQENRYQQITESKAREWNQVHTSSGRGRTRRGWRRSGGGRAPRPGHPVPAMVSVNGSVRAGTEVAGAASTDVKRLHPESGGKAPAVLAADADLAQAAQGIAQATPGIAQSSVRTRDHRRAMTTARKIDAGCVWINCHIPVAAEMPHGGFKHSGHGKDLSSHSLEDYTRVKHVMTYLGS